MFLSLSYPFYSFGLIISAFQPHPDLVLSFLPLTSVYQNFSWISLFPYSWYILFYFFLQSHSIHQFFKISINCFFCFVLFSCPVLGFSHHWGISHDQKAGATPNVWYSMSTGSSKWLLTILLWIPDLFSVLTGASSNLHITFLKFPLHSQQIILPSTSQSK